MPNSPENTPSDNSIKGAHLWWRHEFYRSRWNKWHENWRKLLDASPRAGEDSPQTLLNKFSNVGCDPEIVVRLAFLVASHKPRTQSRLATNTERQQRIKRKLKQARQRLLDSARLLQEVQDDLPLIFISPQNIDAAKHMAEMCAHEDEVLLDPLAPESPGGHELYTLVSYVKAQSGTQNYKLVTDLLEFVYRADRRKGSDQTNLEKQVQRFANMPDSLYPEMIDEHTSDWAKSGELKKNLLACFPGQVSKP